MQAGPTSSVTLTMAWVALESQRERERWEGLV